jgi:hypothetical protein
MSNAPYVRSRWPGAVALIAACLMGTVACDGDPFSYNWNDAPDTVLLYSLARPELNLVSAFNFFKRQSIRVESASATGTWDAAVDTEDGQIVLLTPGVFGVTSTARIATLENMRMDDVTEAPTDTLLYIEDQPVPILAGNVYVIKTNRVQGSFGQRCVYYAKMEPLVVDVAGGTLTFRYIINPICNSQDLVPPN